MARSAKETNGSRQQAGCTFPAQLAMLAQRHTYFLLFCALLLAVCLVALLELPPPFRQSEFSGQPRESALLAQIGRPDKIDINTAVAAELTCLPGIGEAKAQAILSYRAQHGAFSSIEELDNVSGISEGILSQIRPLVTAS